jgi:hypothetical protein
MLEIKYIIVFFTNTEFSGFTNNIQTQIKHKCPRELVLYTAIILNIMG